MMRSSPAYSRKKQVPQHHLMYKLLCRVSKVTQVWCNAVTSHTTWAFHEISAVPMWAMNLAVNLVVQVLSVAVHNHYKRIYNESSNKWWDLSNWIRLFNCWLCGFSLLFLRHEILISWILCVSFYSQFGDLTLNLVAIGLIDGPALAGSPWLH